MNTVEQSGGQVKINWLTDDGEGIVMRVNPRTAFALGNELRQAACEAMGQTSKSCRRFWIG
jgi:hypothetical protein